MTPEQRNQKTLLEKQLDAVIEDIREPPANTRVDNSGLIQRYATLQRQYWELTGERYRVGRTKE